MQRKHVETSGKPWTEIKRSSSCSLRAEVWTGGRERGESARKGTWDSPPFASSAQLSLLGRPARTLRRRVGRTAVAVVVVCDERAVASRRALKSEGDSEERKRGPRTGRAVRVGVVVATVRVRLCGGARGTASQPTPFKKQESRTACCRVNLVARADAQWYKFEPLP